MNQPQKKLKNTLRKIIISAFEFHLQGKKRQHNLESKIIETKILKNKHRKTKLQNCIQGFIPCWRASCCPSLKFEE